MVEICLNSRLWLSRFTPCGKVLRPPACAYRVPITQQIQPPRLRTNHQSMHRHIRRQQRVAADDIHALANALFRRIKSLEPALQVDPRVLEGFDGRSAKHRGRRLFAGRGRSLVWSYRSRNGRRPRLRRR